MQRLSYARNGGKWAMISSGNRIERSGEYGIIGTDRRRDVTLGTLERFGEGVTSEFDR